MTSQVASLGKWERNRVKHAHSCSPSAMLPTPQLQELQPLQWLGDILQTWLRVAEPVSSEIDLVQSSTKLNEKEERGQYLSVRGGPYCASI